MYIHDSRWCLAGALVIGLWAGQVRVHAQDGLPPVFSKKVPESLRDLQEMEKHVQKLVDRVLPCTVCLRIGQAQGSGVVVNRQGHILTAGHVSGKAGRDAVIMLPDGYKINGKTLGANNEIDSGMVVLTEREDLPFVEMARSSEIKKGQWCLSLGHPGGFKPGRPPVVRLGRVLEVNDKVIVTDCTLVGGDSGGPLFDMHGRLIGIHSRIGGKISTNLHVPVDTYRDTWPRLSSGEVWGSPPPQMAFGKPAEPYLGMKAVTAKSALKVYSITPDSPADRAGLRADDTILRFDNEAVTTVEDFSLLLKSRRPGAQITIHVQRGNEALALRVVLGKRAN
jgi:serine protease Do